MGKGGARGLGLGALALATLALSGAAPPPYDWGDDKVASEPRTQGLCRAVKTTPFPAADRTPPAGVSLKGCNAEALYYGIGVKADPARARLCAYANL
ncbi:MAG: hypothetical protein EON96_10675, partial [Caulobacteraceae bacterium]